MSILCLHRKKIRMLSSFSDSRRRRLCCGRPQKWRGRSACLSLNQATWEVKHLLGRQASSETCLLLDMKTTGAGLSLHAHWGRTPSQSTGSGDFRLLQGQLEGSQAPKDSKAELFTQPVWEDGSLSASEESRSLKNTYEWP